MSDNTGAPHLLSLLALAVLTVVTALALVDMWRWFVVPLGLPKIGFAHAFGLDILLSFITHQYPPEDPDELVRRSKDVRLQGFHRLYATLRTLTAWAFAYVAHLLMTGGPNV